MPENAIKSLTISEILGSENKNIPEVVVKGVLSEMTDRTTKHDKPFISGVVSDKEIEIPYIMWDISKSGFYSKYELGSDSIRAGSFLGSIELYEGNPQLIIKKVKMMSNEEGAQFLFTSKLPYETMMDYITEEVGKIEEAPTRNVCIETVDKTGKRYEYYPYSTLYHRERGGFVAHVYNCLKMADGICTINDELSRDVIYGSILLHHLSVFQMMKVDPTGAVLDDGAMEEALYGSVETASLLLAFNKLRAVEEKGKPLSRVKQGIIHCLACLVNAEPATAEASVFVGIVNTELRQNYLSEIDRSLVPGEVRLNRDGSRSIKL